MFELKYTNFNKVVIIKTILNYKQIIKEIFLFNHLEKYKALDRLFKKNGKLH